MTNESAVVLSLYLKLDTFEFMLFVDLRFNGNDSILSCYQ